MWISTVQSTFALQLARGASLRCTDQHQQPFPQAEYADPGQESSASFMNNAHPLHWHTTQEPQHAEHQRWRCMHALRLSFRASILQS